MMGSKQSAPVEAAIASGVVTPLQLSRARAALRTSFVGDSIAMPVHWFYNTRDIYKFFGPSGITKLEDAPSSHPSSIMNLHSTSRGGRGAHGGAKEVVGDVILRGKREFWGRRNGHYHQGMRAGENTLNSHCARVALRYVTETRGKYDPEKFLSEYISFMTAEEPRHPDTYAESYHRGFFANFIEGTSPTQCGAVTHDTASVGGLVTVAPVAIAMLLAGNPVTEVSKVCATHVMLTHPDKVMAKVTADYVKLINQLLFRGVDEPPQPIIAKFAKDTMNFDVTSTSRHEDDRVIGGMFSPACYIDGSWPGVLHLANKYSGVSKSGDRKTVDALASNANCGGDNVHRGSVLGVLLGLSNNDEGTPLFKKLKDAEVIDSEITSLFDSLGVTAVGQ